MNRGNTRTIVLLLLVSSAMILDTVPSYADTINTSIFAGSGKLGNLDGPPSEASFLMPTQMAFDAKGDLLVSDTGAQRVRLVDQAGNVSTIAGSGPINASGLWVDGGYVDGPALTARFNRPEGIAVLPSGTVLVSDRDNRCIRSIVGGFVSTYAGNPETTSPTDGPRISAHFSSPRQLAVAKDGTVYVADWKAGVRMISPDGYVSTLRINNVTLANVTGVALGESPSLQVLFIADSMGIVRVLLPGLSASRIYSFPSGDNTFSSTLAPDARMPLGVPYSIGAFDAFDTVFTDLHDSSVKFFRYYQLVRHLGQVPLENAVLNGGGSEFDPSGPEYDEPMGVSIAKDGDAFVADTGNRRIIRIRPFDRKTYATPADLPDLRFPPDTYRVALVGTSFTWFSTSVDDSIGGNLEHDLSTALDVHKNHVSVRYVGLLGLLGEFDLMDNVLSLGAADCVVFLLSPIDPYGMRLGKDVGAWGPKVRARLIRTAKLLKAAHIPFLIAVNPGPGTLSPISSAYLFNDVDDDPSAPHDYDEEHRDMMSVVNGVGVPVVDLFPAFREEIEKSNHRVLFQLADIHYTAYGRQFVARQLTASLNQLRPWEQK